MLIYILIALCFFLPTQLASAANDCIVFQYSIANSVQQGNCRELVKRDQDADGIPDFVSNRLYGSTLFPFDDDLNNNGVPDLIEKQPEAFQTSWQITLWQKYGLLAIGQNGKDEAKIWQAIDHILSAMNVSRQMHTLERLRYILPLNERDARRAYAYYIEPAHAISFDPKLAQLSQKKLYAVLAHEIGHALIFSRLSAENLRELAETQAGWLLKYSTLDHYDGVFLRKFPGQARDTATFPTYYSRANVHEWFAEHVSQFVLDKLGLARSSSPGMSQYFVNLLACKDKRISKYACLANRSANMASQPLFESNNTLHATLQL